MLNPTDTAQNYIDKLEISKQLADGAYQKAKAEADQLEKEYQRALAWEALLKGYKEAMEKTDRLAEDIDGLLNKAIAQTGDTVFFAQKAEYAYQWLICEALEIAKCLEYFKKCVVDVVKKPLMTSVDANDPIYKGLATLAAGLTEAFNCVLVALLELLKTLKAAKTLYAKLDMDGLEEKLQQIQTEFKNGSRYDYSGIGSWTTCTQPPKPALPLKVSQKDSGYWSDTMKAYADVTGCLDSLRTDMEKKTKLRDAAKSCIDSLGIALAAAKSANACKTK